MKKTMENEIRVKNVFPIVNGLFAHMSIDIADFGLSSTDDLDLLLVSKCGNRLITPIVEILLENDTLPESALTRLGVLIMSEYGETWTRVRESLKLEYNPLQNSVYKETETTNTDSETGDTSQEVRADDVSTFDTDPSNYASAGKTTNDSTATGTQKQAVTRVLERTSNGTGFSSSDLVKSEIEMRIANRFTEQVLTDVKNYIAMAIY